MAKNNQPKNSPSWITNVFTFLTVMIVRSQDQTMHDDRIQFKEGICMQSISPVNMYSIIVIVTPLKTKNSIADATTLQPGGIKEAP